jgi:2-iminoacetate synthase ThiH
MPTSAPELHGERAFYGVNMNLNYTTFASCAAALRVFEGRGREGAYLYSLDEIERVRDAAAHGIDECISSAGCIRIEDRVFTQMLRRIKA